MTDLPEKESQLTCEESSPVPPSEEQPVGKKAVSEKVRTALKEPTLSAEITKEHSDPFDSFGCEPSIPEKQPPQPVKQSPAKMPSAKTQSTKKQTSSPKVRTPQRKKQQPPATGEPAPRTKQAPPSVSREVSGKQKSDNAAISTPKPRKRKKGAPPKGQLPKLKKQAAPVVEPPKLRNKSETQGEPPKLKKELLMPEKTSPWKKNQSQQETDSISTTGNSLVPPSEEQPMEKKAVSKKATPEKTSPRKKIQSQQETDSVSTTRNSPVLPSEEQPMEKKAVAVPVEMAIINSSIVDQAVLEAAQQNPCREAKQVDNEDNSLQEGSFVSKSGAKDMLRGESVLKEQGRRPHEAFGETVFLRAKEGLDEVLTTSNGQRARKPFSPVCTARFGVEVKLLQSGDGSFENICYLILVNQNLPEDRQFSGAPTLVKLEICVCFYHLVKAKETEGVSKTQECHPALPDTEWW
ncbi:hypothetical protein JD844_001391 [Phrynosoma platyrhinos]|uniref:Uncharacterized protein n=1 Tax=Phrynosoma platyrhinos TaxID=52577 RepID=A0ABQ7T9N2_PHRPL|nr:hypothetical protein JD844_001391 [Phrynosoma platyrhinos]